MIARSFVCICIALAALTARAEKFALVNGTVIDPRVAAYETMIAFL